VHIVPMYRTDTSAVVVAEPTGARQTSRGG
jgi:hypothetical protein